MSEHEADRTRRERRRQTAAAVVVGTYRLARACQLYDDANQSVLQPAAALADAVGQYAAAHGQDRVRILFTREVVFVDKRILRVPRETYALGLQLGAWILHSGLNELTIEAHAAASALRQLARLVADAQRDPTAAAKLAAAGIPGVSLRKAPEPDRELATEAAESPLVRVARAYAASLLIVRTHHEEVRRGEAKRGHEVKRVAQKLVALAEEQSELLTAMAAGRFPDADTSRLAVSTAVVAVAMTKQLTSDRQTLGAVALGALLADVGALRLSEGAPRERVAANALLELTLSGRFHPLALKRSVAVWEAVSAHAEPSVIASILATARRFNELRAPRSAGKPVSIDDAIRALADESGAGRDSFVRMLVAALGFYPLRTVVELDTGEVAIVTGVPAVALDFARPRVQVMTDRSQAVLDAPFEVDLARPAQGQPARRVVRPLVLGAGAGRG